jgi:hypothetical protein
VLSINTLNKDIDKGEFVKNPEENASRKRLKLNEAIFALAIDPSLV